LLIYTVLHAKKTRNKEKRAKLVAKAHTEEDNAYPKSLLKIFVNKNLLQQDGISKDTVQARLIEGQGEKWVNPYETDTQKLVLDLPLYTSSIKPQAWYVIDKTMACKLTNIPKGACHIVETSNMAVENLNIGVKIPVQNGPFCEGQHPIRPYWRL
jgi:hypothetical protein